MGEPSAEALGMARELYGNDEAALAAALQRFMDAVEKAEALADKQNQALTQIVEPWERAKRQYEAGAAVVLGFKERAEKAERQLEAEREWFAIARRGLDEKNVFIAKVKAWAAESDTDDNSLAALITEYEGGERD